MSKNERKAPDFRRSPKGIFLFPHINTPDTGPKSSPGAPKYKTSLIVDPSEPDVAQFLTDVEDAANTAFNEEKARLEEVLAAAKNPKEKKTAEEALKALTLRIPVYDHYDKDGNDTGKKQIAFSSVASYTPRAGKNAGKKIDNKPAVMGPNGKPTKVTVTVGSEGFVSTYFSPYANGPNAGVTLRLVAVMLTKLRAPLTPRDADYYGFAPVEGAEGFDEPGDDADADAGDDAGGGDDGHAF